MSLPDISINGNPDPDRLADLCAALKQVIAEKDSAIDQRDHRIAELTALLRWYEEQFRLSKHRLYGSSSEQNPLQESFVFNEAEAVADEPAPDEGDDDTETITYQRRKTKGQREAKLENLPVEKIPYELPVEEQICGACGGDLHRMTQQVRQEIKIVPAKVSVVEHIQGIYSCRKCEKKEISTPIIKAPMPAPAFPKSLASPSSVAYLIDQKYTMGLPLYRLEQSFERLGLDLSRQTMANWVIKAGELLLPVYNALHQRLLTFTIILADETTVQVLHEAGRRPQSDSYMWLYRSGRYDLKIALFEYQATRAGEHPKRFLQGFAGTLQTDGYVAYDAVENVIRAGCLGHARRGFVDAIKAMRKNAIRSDRKTLPEQGLAYCDRLFIVERSLHDCTPDERLAGRKALSQPILDEFKLWLDKWKGSALPKGLVATAINYCLNQWDRLTVFMQDGRLEIDNNRSERTIKPFVIGRKNWLFANTPRGATTSALLYSIVETAKENGLIPFEYLVHLLTTLPTIIDRSSAKRKGASDPTGAIDADKMEALMPWSQTLPASCYLRKPEPGVDQPTGQLAAQVQTLGSSP